MKEKKKNRPGLNQYPNCNTYICVVTVFSNGEYLFSQVTFTEGKECEAMKELYKVLKDHKNSFMEELVQSSYRQSFVRELRSVVGEEIPSSQELDECGSENVVRVTLVNSRFQSSLATATDKLIGAGLRVDKFGFDAAGVSSESSSSSLEETSGDKMLSDKLTVLINDISIAMNRLGYASYRGTVYKKEARSKFTYAYKCDAAAFINTMATNEFFKARLVREMRNVIGLLSDPFCELFAPLTINHDLIEVNDGWCWSIKRRSFLENAIQDHQIGKVSPRAFCPYDQARDPDPKYFKEVLENSLGEQDLRNFCDDFLKLLSYNQKRHKDKVPCLVGDANSGKTSLFFPILGLIHHGNVATVTKQRAFNKSMITPYTEVIFIDEATEKTLDMDDWKILTQGGYAAHDVKYRNARAFINRCPMLITSQRKLDFGPADQPAMDRRLRTYTFRSLPQPKKRASAWMKKHAMDCVIWAAQMAKAPEEDEESADEEETSASEDELTAAEGVLLEEEKGAIRALSLPALLTQDAPADEVEEALTDDTHPDDTDSSPEDDRVKDLQNLIQQSHPGTLRRRQLEQMLKMEQRRRNEEERLQQEQHGRRQALFRRRGVSSQNARLLPINPDEPIPSPIVRDIQRHERVQKAAEEELRREKARVAYAGNWLRSTEKDLKECVEKCNAALDPSLLKNLRAYKEILCEKLKLHHRNLVTLNTKEAVEERRRVCIELGILREEDQHLVKSVAEPLPTEARTPPELEGDNAEEELFITPQSTSCNPSAARKKRPTRGGLPRSQPVAKKPKNTLFNYYQSQK